MRKWIVRILCLILCLCLFGTLVLPALAAETEEETEQPEYEAEITIRSREDFLEFAEACRLDSYSFGLLVTLAADIDLTGVEFESIPIFCGTFDGGNHTISGLSIRGEGSVVGLFRYLESTAVVCNLQVEGEVIPQGSRTNVGGIAGSNGGHIENCKFTGTIAGTDYVGGLVGVNEVTGIVDNCFTAGTITGNHFIGGMAGINYGVIRNSTNRAEINTTSTQNEVEISDITLETLTESEAANTVTDVGGIAGSSSGVIRDCRNNGNVGYQQMGYNIGGIAGTQTGYITGCTNYGQIYGRKEVGGIVGQMEPTTLIEYTEDTLQTLQKQLNSLGSMASQAIYKAQNTTSTISGEIENIRDQVQDAKDAVESLVPDKEAPSLPDMDTIQAAQSTLSSSLAGMQSSLKGAVSATEEAGSSLTSTLSAISGQVAAMSATLNAASENLGGSISDISDLDTELDLTGKVIGCYNYGDVLADHNVGGIVGAVAFENDLDPEEDVQISGSSSLNFHTQLRSVVLSCENHALITVKKQNGGGIVGWMSMGLVRDCLNTGEVSGESADYVGGIAGNSEGYIRRCSAKARLTGDDYVGGIAGVGTTVTDCRSMADLTGTEKVGAILGFRQEPKLSDEEEEEAEAVEKTDPVLGNYYLAVGTDRGGIDGISYAAQAEPLARGAFLELADLSRVFQSVNIRFVLEDGTEKKISLTPGSALDVSRIPELPQKEGYTARWAGLEEADLSEITFNMTFHAEYTLLLITIQSEETNENGLPILIAQGSFAGEQYVLLTDDVSQPISISNSVSAETEWLGSYGFSVEDGTVTALRYLYTGEYAAEDLTVMVLGDDDTWREVSCTGSGSYLVFDTAEGDTAFCVLYTPSGNGLLWVLIGIAAALVVAIAVTIVLVKRKKK